jgi:hypothetical protein
MIRSGWFRFDEDTRGLGRSGRSSPPDGSSVYRSTARGTGDGVGGKPVVLSANCRNFLAAKGIDLGNLLAAAAKTMFWNRDLYWNKTILSLPGVKGPFEGKSVLGDLWPTYERRGVRVPYSDMHGVVVKNDAGEYYNHVVFVPGKFSSGLHVFHEILHIALEKTDSQLGRDSGLTNEVLRRARMGASEAITSFFDPHQADCDPTRLRR